MSDLMCFWELATHYIDELAEVRHGMVEKTPNPFRMKSGDRWVYTTFAIELKTLR